jgi:hypothetical protein
VVPLLPAAQAVCKRSNSRRNPPSAKHSHLSFFDLPTAIIPSVRRSQSANNGLLRVQWPDGFNIAAVEAAVIVSVDVAEFAPGVTEFGDRAQVAFGVDPLTVQAS